MRIAVFIKRTTFHKGHGGLETQNEVLCQGLAARGHKITVFSPIWELIDQRASKNGVDYVFVPCRYRMFFGFPHLDKNNWVHKSVAAFTEENKKEKYELVIGQSSAATALIKRKHEFGLKTISISHGTILSEYKTKVRNIASLKELVWLVKDTGFVLHNFFFWQRAFVRGSDKIVAVSNAVKRALIDETFISEEKITVIHNGLDTHAFNIEGASQVATKKDPSKITINYTGRIVRQKGIFILVDAIAALATKENIVVNIFGDGEDGAKLEKYIKDKKLEGVIKTYGKVSHAEVLANLQASDIFVLPSVRVEGLPMVLIEAMFAGLPIVASNIGGVSDAVDDKTGFLVRPGSKTELKDKLLVLINNPNLRAEMAQNAKIKAQNAFTLDKMLNSYEKVMQEVINK